MDNGQKLRVLDLFSGIGGFSLGLERTGGFETVAFCEIEAFPRKVLAKHWPEVPIYEDVRTLTAERLAADGIAVDVICGGFPCQDISVAGRGEGIAGERSGLWSEIARLISELGPSYVIVENVAALLGRGMDSVLRDLAAVRYDAEWHCIPASAVGAHHRRDRIWIVAYAGHSNGSRSETVEHQDAGELALQQENWIEGPTPTLQRGEALADAEGSGLEGRMLGRNVRSIFSGFGKGCRPVERDWLIEPDVGRVAHGIPDRSHRLKGLGNAVVPQIPELIGHAILASIAAERLAA